ncbi:MAG: PIG-L family deacetylase, partial [Bacteroidia bacterium]|nr:PIG-L family deacetylase [Bacteroidia bacterium]
MKVKADVLVIAAHPDDAELGCAGTIIKLITAGKNVVIADLTAGELGTRGNVETRKQEAIQATQLLGIADRTNLRLRDGFFQVNEYEIRELIRVIRIYQPEIILANAPFDRHPDHGKAGKLAKEAAFLAGLPKLETFHEGIQQT